MAQPLNLAFSCFVQCNELLNKIIEIKWKRIKFLYQHGQKKGRYYALSVNDKFVKRQRVEKEEFQNLYSSMEGDYDTVGKDNDEDNVMVAVLSAMIFW